jgi:hypothetical protein
VRTPFLVCEHGWWTWRPTQTLPDGSELLRVWQLPGDTVQLRSGQELLASTRPGPGSLRRVALRDPEPASVTVRVLQASGLAPPSVVLGADFDTVFVDGRAWSWYDERTVWLPDRAAVFQVVARRQNGAPQPHVIACSTPLEECSYDAGARELSLTAGADATRPFALPCTAVLAGPVPTRVDGGEVVADDELRHATAAERAQAAAKGVVIRFRAGRVRVCYAD